VTAAYVGNSQIFPNIVEITAAAFDDATMTAAQTATDYTVAGQIGSSFTLTGSSGATGPTGTQTLGVSPTTYSIAVTDNSGCGAGARTPQIVITPQGSTTLASGLSNTDTISQAAGGTITTYTPGGVTASITNTVSNTVTVGAQQRFGQGSKWTVTFNMVAGSYSPSATFRKAFPRIQSKLQVDTGAGYTSPTWAVTNFSQPSGATQYFTSTAAFGPASAWHESTAAYTCEIELTGGSVTQLQYIAEAVDNYLYTGVTTCGRYSSSYSVSPYTTLRFLSGNINTSNINGSYP
jgi:hypothetical protein